MDYTRLSLSAVASGLEEIGGEALSTFGALDAAQLNWKPDADRWSVAQCFEHLLTTNRLMFGAMASALDDATPRSLWQRLPLWPGLLGTLMVRSLSPQATRRLKAPAPARPAASDLAADIVERFADQHRQAVVELRTLDEPRAARTIMTSPFARVVTYSVRDAWRLILAHDRRHLEQARRVTQLPQFPGAASA
jgi:hypothetical protein